MESIGNLAILAILGGIPALLNLALIMFPP